VFKIVEIKRYVWTVDYSADSYIDLLNTYSGHIAWPQWKRDRRHKSQTLPPQDPYRAVAQKHASS